MPQISPLPSPVAGAPHSPSRGHSLAAAPGDLCSLLVAALAALQHQESLDHGMLSPAMASRALGPAVPQGPRCPQSQPPSISPYPGAPHPGRGGGRIWCEPPSGLRDTVPPGLLSLQSLPEGHSLISRASEEPQHWRVQKGGQRELETGQETKWVTSGMEMGPGLASLHWAQGT